MMFLIVSQPDWKQAKEQGFYTAPSLEKEGFLHCSYATQVIEIMNERFQGRSDILLLQIDPSKVEARVVEEYSTRKQQNYPHIYGVLNASAVVQEHVMKPNDEGKFSLPAVGVKMSSNSETKKMGM